MELNQKYEINSLSDYVKKIKEFATEDMLWFRGQGNHQYHLLPNLYRENVVDFGENDYNSIHLAEDMRIQQYYATNYSFIKGSGINTTEWLGMGQHFGLKTRFLDWSTSALHALMFALESYADKKTADVQTAIPCVWALKPQKMNKRIVEELFNNSGDLEKRLMEATQSKEELKELIELIGKLKEIGDPYKYILKENNPENHWNKMDYIYDLAYFDRLLERVRSNPKLAFSGDIVNPIFYLLACVYIEGYSAGECLNCTPLAVVHPLNSERIREQRGVFTVFPFPNKKLYKGSDGLEYMRMEHNSYITGNLCKLVLKKPEHILAELRCLGVNRSWLYFEPDKITEEIER